MKLKHNNPNPCDSLKNSVKGKVHSNTCLPQEIRKKSNKQPNFTTKVTRKRRNEKPED